MNFEKEDVNYIRLDTSDLDLIFEDLNKESKLFTREEVVILLSELLYDKKDPDATVFDVDAFRKYLLKQKIFDDELGKFAEKLVVLSGVDTYVFVVKNSFIQFRILSDKNKRKYLRIDTSDKDLVISKGIKDKDSEKGLFIQGYLISQSFKSLSMYYTDGYEPYNVVNNNVEYRFCNVPRMMLYLSDYGCNCMDISLDFIINNVKTYIFVRVSSEKFLRLILKDECLLNELLSV